MNSENAPADGAKSGDAMSESILSVVLAKFADTGVVIYSHDQHGDETVVVNAEDILDVMKFLRNDDRLKFEMMMDLTAVDYLDNQSLNPYLVEMNARYEVVYHLYSVEKNHRVRIKAPLTEDNCFINSVTGVWGGADWFEREAWDMYGIVFRGHPNLKRILLYDKFEGHPLRKDYPKTKRQPLIGPKN
jgi:NADH-quinone oxidoreductase subunit C